jgi:hypothetical protein
MKLSETAGIFLQNFSQLQWLQQANAWAVEWAGKALPKSKLSRHANMPWIRSKISFGPKFGSPVCFSDKMIIRT